MDDNFGMLFPCHVIHRKFSCGGIAAHSGLILLWETSVLIIKPHSIVLYIFGHGTKTAGASGMSVRPAIRTTQLRNFRKAFFTGERGNLLKSGSTSLLHLARYFDESLIKRPF